MRLLGCIFNNGDSIGIEVDEDSKSLIIRRGVGEEGLWCVPTYKGSTITNIVVSTKEIDPRTMPR